MLQWTLEFAHMMRRRRSRRDGGQENRQGWTLTSVLEFTAKLRG